MKRTVFVLWLSVAAFFIVGDLAHPDERARSIHDGVWIITHTGCNGKTTVYENCRVLDINDVYITFTTAGRSREIKLPVATGCSETILERRH